MTLEIGQVLSQYRVLARLGAGGMGEVWRARDEHLGREVALKVLSAEFVADPERLRRLEREARALASLSHPNVAVVHGFDSVGGTAFLAMELVPGEDLAARLARGPLSLQESIDVARQIAEGLEAAHEAGLIHRDLKPANVCLTPEGRVKLLDFGLAKAERGAVPEGSGRTPPSSVLTMEGLILGTPTYMSPEQARGKPVDRRVDVWAFGCVLYECLTARRAFAGETFGDVLTRVLGEEPDWSALPSWTPPHVARLLRRCLEKDPRRRLRDIGEARIALEGGAGAQDSVPELAGEARPAARSRLSLLAIGLLGLAGGAWIARAWLAVPPAQTTPARTARFAVELPPDFAAAEILDLAVDRGGSTLAFSLRGTKNGILLRDLGALDARLLEGPVGARDLCFSADGRWLVYHERGSQKLRKLSVAGGKPIDVAIQTECFGVAMSEEGLTVTSSEWASGLVAFGENEGPRPLTDRTALAGGLGHLEPSFLPGDRALVFCVWNGRGWDQAGIAVHRLDSGETRLLEENGTTPSFLRFPGAPGDEGALLWVQTDAIWARRFDPVALVESGASVPVQEGVLTHIGSGRSLYSVSDTGTLAYAEGTSNREVEELVWVDPGVGEEPVLPQAGDYDQIDLARSGERAVLIQEGNLFHVVGVDLTQPLEARRPRRIDGEADSYDACLSPDGRWVAYISNPTGEYRVYVRSFEATEEPREIFDGPAGVQDWSSDGRWLVLERLDPQTRSDLWLLPLEESAAGPRASGPLQPFLCSRASEGASAVSPDGRFLAYISDESGTFEIYVVPFPGGGTSYPVSRGGGAFPAWSQDGSKLYYTRSGTLFAVDVRGEGAFSSSAPVKLADDFPIEAYSFHHAPDGRFLALRANLAASRLRLVVVEGFAAEVERALSTP